MIEEEIEVCNLPYLRKDAKVYSGRIFPNDYNKKLFGLPWKEYSKTNDEKYLNQFIEFFCQPVVFYVIVKSNLYEVKITRDLKDSYFINSPEHIVVDVEQEMHGLKLFIKEFASKLDLFEKGLTMSKHIPFLFRLHLAMNILHKGKDINDRGYEYVTVKESNYSHELIAQVHFFSTDKKLIEGDYALNFYNQIINKRRKNKEQKTNSRTPFTKSIRYEVFLRDDFKCKFCGATKDETTLHVDHIIPVSRGGDDTLSNLQTLCKACNLSKANRITKPQEKSS